MATGGWFSSLLGRDRSEARDQMVRESLDDDADWCDVSHGEEEGEGCEKSMDGAGGQQDKVALKPIEDDKNNSVAQKQKEKANRHSMPSLFSLTLPPCGPNVQVAYENVVKRLRALYLQPGGTIFPPAHTKLVCQEVLVDLEYESEFYPAGTQLHTSRRTPWRSEIVFKYEVAWAKYFFREVQMLEQWPTMTEQAKEKQDFANRMFPIPKELGFVVKRKEMRDGVLELWRKWHEEKRGSALVMEGSEEVVEDQEQSEGGKVVKTGSGEQEVEPENLNDGMKSLESGMKNLKKG